MPTPVALRSSTTSGITVMLVDATPPSTAAECTTPTAMAAIPTEKGSTSLLARAVPRVAFVSPLATRTTAATTEDLTH